VRSILAASEFQNPQTAADISQNIAFGLPWVGKGQTDRQTDRQTARQTNRKAHTAAADSTRKAQPQKPGVAFQALTERQTDIQTDKHTKRRTNIQTDRQARHTKKHVRPFCTTPIPLQKEYIYIYIYIYVCMYVFM
jgi:hypothetical protein